MCVEFTVSCSTTTVIKCRAALKTLQAFPFFKPTCLCREPKIDYECNSFRNFLFDHPCNFTQRKGNKHNIIDFSYTIRYIFFILNAYTQSGFFFYRKWDNIIHRVFKFLEQILTIICKTIKCTLLNVK
ncbi:GDNF family receptor alpha-like [Aphis craccivora]|uniref:GDNF family receptor alpha-like n=1 Tax=Aphis craccivora TaxID=307492 RepID=A0A6G0Z516_APHCR|nr:GDNF family receptor alpha-like [Aphis craccivora]